MKSHKYVSMSWEIRYYDGDDMLNPAFMLQYRDKRAKRYTDEEMEELQILLTHWKERKDESRLGS